MVTNRVFPIIHYLIAYVFLAAGILKWVSPNFVTIFANLGLPFPQVTVLIVATVEIIAASLILFNLYVKQAAISLVIIMIVAILLSKMPILFNQGILTFAFEARLDIVMLTLLLVTLKQRA
ncbi:DoxX family protein [Aquibacillus sediminis]|uniref:DoxX family protein n=1 Tax=Aquibacillus sediminis TaxID=2574734 RepID=UPI001109F99A|nr:DoxX family protein [Aquibacillus sediminis]